MGSPVLKLRPLVLPKNVRRSIECARATGRDNLARIRHRLASCEIESAPVRERLERAGAWYVEAASRLLEERRRQAGPLAALVPLELRPVDGAKWAQGLAGFAHARPAPSPAAPPATTSSTVRPLEEPHHGN